MIASIAFKFFQLIGWIIRLTPFSLKRGIAVVGAYFWFYVVGFRRKVILLNLSFAFPRLKEESSESFRKRISSLALKNLENYFLGFFEVLEKTTWNQKTLDKKVQVIGLDILREASQKGGVFLVSAHLGNWEAALALSQKIGRPISAIARFVRNSFWDKVLRKSREQFELNLLPERSSGIASVKAVKRGDLVVFMLDQHTGEPHGILAKFFGLEAWSAKGLSIMAVRLKAPVFPVFSVRERDLIKVIIGPQIDFSEFRDELNEEELLRHVQKFNDVIEEWVRKYPEQYFWIHRRFKAHFDYKTEKLPF